MSWLHDNLTKTTKQQNNKCCINNNNILTMSRPGITSRYVAVGSTFGISQNFKHYQTLVGQCMLNFTHNMQYYHALICSNMLLIFHGACHDLCHIVPCLCNNSSMCLVGHWRVKIPITCDHFSMTKWQSRNLANHNILTPCPPVCLFL